MYGYITVDFIAFPDSKNKKGHLLFFAIGLDCYINDLSAIMFYYNFLMNGRYQSGNYLIENDSN